jgi:3-oxoacyl-[acyl-carrier-protein] synthase II
LSKQVVITGMGTVNPLGHDCSSTWEKLIQGQSGIDTLTCISTEDLDVKIGGEVKDLNLKRAEINDVISSKRMDRASLFAVIAAREALEHAGLITDSDLTVKPYCSVVLGAGLSGLETLQSQTENLLHKGPSKVSPFTIPLLMPNACAANVSMAYGIRGACYVTSSACASSGNAMIDACHLIRNGESPLVVTGGTEASLTRLGLSSFIKMQAMAKGFNDNPTKAIKPFDANRTGLIMSEGAGILVFEDRDHAISRGAKIYGEVLGHGNTSDAFHLVRPEPEGIQFGCALAQAFRSSQLNPQTVAHQIYVNAHGTGTYMNDVTESNALIRVFGEYASQLKISSTKSMTGHMIGATCALEMIICSMVLQNRMAPPTINYETPDPKCTLNYIPNQAIHGDFEYAVNNTLGFGGHNISLILKR